MTCDDKSLLQMVKIEGVILVTSFVFPPQMVLKLNEVLSLIKT